MCLSIAISRPDHVLAKGEHLGFQWVVTHNGHGYRCGYVRVPLGHRWHGADCDAFAVAAVDVHGGLTFAEADVPCDAPGPDTDWWLGFDCAHLRDAPDPSLLGVSPDSGPFFEGTVVCSQEYVEAQCRSLCEQAAAIALSPSSND